MRDDRDDFPAAHSMDTNWFAIDADGHLAVLDSGEGGAVPKGVTTPEDGRRFLERLGRDAPGVVWANGSVRGRHCREPGADPKEARGLYGVLLFLRRLPDWKQPSYSKLVVGPPIESSGGAVIPVYCGSLADDVYARLHDAAGCAGCGALDGADSGNLGLFEYDCEEYDLDPYARVGVPARPLKEGDLPPELLSQVAAVRLPLVRFAQSPLFQPIEHLPCHVWGPAETFVRSDGKTRVPMPPEPGARGV